MDRYRLRHALGVVAIVLFVVGILAFVLAKVLDWSSIGATIGMWMSWAPPALIASVFLVLVVRLVIPHRLEKGDERNDAGEQINDLYLGRVSSPTIARSSDEYSAYPLPGGDDAPL